jgi:hypothetical protein
VTSLKELSLDLARAWAADKNAIKVLGHGCDIDASMEVLSRVDKTFDSLPCIQDSVHVHDLFVLCTFLEAGEIHRTHIPAYVRHGPMPESTIPLHKIVSEVVQAFSSAVPQYVGHILDSEDDCSDDLSYLISFV